MNDDLTRLVIRRRRDESFLVGRDIEIKVDDVDQGYVTISIVAPRYMKIMRTELFNKKLKD